MTEDKREQEDSTHTPHSSPELTRLIQDQKNKDNTLEDNKKCKYTDEEIGITVCCENREGVGTGIIYALFCIYNATELKK